jgi:hypothetical protein
VTLKDCVQLNGGFLDKMVALVAEKGFRMRMSAAQMFTFVRKARSAAKKAGTGAVRLIVSLRISLLCLLYYIRLSESGGEVVMVMVMVIRLGPVQIKKGTM